MIPHPTCQYPGPTLHILFPRLWGPSYAGYQAWWPLALTQSDFKTLRHANGSERGGRGHSDWISRKFSFKVMRILWAFWSFLVTTIAVEERFGYGSRSCQGVTTRRSVHSLMSLTRASFAHESHRDTNSDSNTLHQDLDNHREPLRKTSRTYTELIVHSKFYSTITRSTRLCSVELNKLLTSVLDSSARPVIVWKVMTYPIWGCY